MGVCVSLWDTCIYTYKRRSFPAPLDVAVTIVVKNNAVFSHTAAMPQTWGSLLAIAEFVIGEYCAIFLPRAAYLKTNGVYNLQQEQFRQPQSKQVFATGFKNKLHESAVIKH